ncbi:FIST signal transduction protein [Cryptosporangium sp. NPDC051539]|uniref:FIST signal transduction protein n=1 Tax=Cryptosporangium sp. NPDC051539 TaxID=3363962 RepID=UPI0037A270F3
MADTWVNVGCSADVDSRLAGAEAARVALAGDDPRLLIAFFAGTHDPEAVAAGVRSVGGEVSLIGCPTAGEIADGWAGDGAVVVVALGGPGLAVKVSGTEVIDPDAAERRDTGVRASVLRDAGARAVAPFESLPGGDHRFALVLTDGQAGHQQDLIRGAYAAVGASVPLVGGCGASPSISAFANAPLICDDRVLRNGVVAASIASDNPFGIGLRHGWERTGDAVEVTSTDRNEVLELDHQPALDTYLTLLDAPDECWTDEHAFQSFSLLHPLALRRPGGDEVRVVAYPNYENRSFSSAADVPADSVAWLLRGDADALLTATDEAFDAAIAGVGDRPVAGLLAFDCVGRRGVLAPRGLTDVTRMTSRAAGASFAGFYCHGEIARTRGTTGYHNQALVVLALS